MRFDLNSEHGESYGTRRLGGDGQVHVTPVTEDQ